MTVVSTYFMVMVSDMERATAFYRDAFGAEVKFASPYWTSLQIAGVAIGLHHGGGAQSREIGLGFDVDDLDAACASVERTGGRIVKPPEHKPTEGITIATIADTEGNEFSLTLARGNE
jgi:predicted enzyme related to lactoylglutathione lyase